MVVLGGGALALARHIRLSSMKEVFITCSRVTRGSPTAALSAFPVMDLVDEHRLLRRSGLEVLSGCEGPQELTEQG